MKNRLHDLAARAHNARQVIDDGALDADLTERPARALVALSLLTSGGPHYRASIVREGSQASCASRQLRLQLAN